jgi:hypothetical protein
MVGDETADLLATGMRLDMLACFAVDRYIDWNKSPYESRRKAQPQHKHAYRNAESRAKPSGTVHGNVP